MEKTTGNTTRNLTIVIPAFNEAASIRGVIQDLKTHCSDIVADFIVVNDCSTDNTAEIAAGEEVTVVSHPFNRGYGAALSTGIKSAKTEYVVTFDGDGQYFAADIRRLWEKASGCEMVSGMRTQLFHSLWWRMPGKWVLRWMASYLLKKKLPDLNSGLRLFHTDTIRKYLRICPAGFSFSTTSMMVMLYMGHRVEFVPVEVKPRCGRSTVSLSTGFETIILILRLAALFNPLRMFLPLSAVSAAFGVVWGMYHVLAGEGLSVAGLLGLVTAVLLFALGLICDQISLLRLEKLE